MMIKKDIAEETIIECAVCLEEIPVSAAKVSDIQDYIQYYCGIDCYKIWQDKHKKQLESDLA